MNALSYSIISVFIISLISFLGILSLGIKEERLRKFLIYMVSFSAGALFGDAFLHIAPLVFIENFATRSAFLIIFGILLFFGLEKFILWRHCHMPITKTHVHSFAYMNLVGDGLHNFIDGLIIAASFIVSVPLGIATSIAVFFHEIPQEIGEFGILVHGGFTKKKAIIFNYLTALIAFVGLAVGFSLNGVVDNLQLIVLPIAMGGFIYIAGSDLIPELHKETAPRVAFWQIFSFAVGVVIMAVLLLIG